MTLPEIIDYLISTKEELPPKNLELPCYVMISEIECVDDLNYYLHIDITDGEEYMGIG